MNERTAPFDSRNELDAWLEHLFGSKRRAHEYKRMAIEAELLGKTDRYCRYRAWSDQQWTNAKTALKWARRAKARMI